MLFITPARSNLKVIVFPAQYLYDNLGNRRYQAGKSAQFVDGLFETDDKEIIDFLLASPRCGIDYMVQKGQGIDAHVSQEGQEELAKEAEALSTTVHSCPNCSFKAKNEAGLKSHLRLKHADE
jgi:hypothetical protein